MLSLAVGCSHGAGGAAATSAPAETSTSAARDELDGCVGKRDGKIVRMKVGD